MTTGRLHSLDFPRNAAITEECAAFSGMELEPMSADDSAPRAEPWTPAWAGVSLPPSYVILPYSVPFEVPGFLRHSQPTHFTLAPEPVDCVAWFERFASRVVDSVSRKHLPV